MNVEQELVQWLKNHIPDTREHKNRDVDAVLLYYGFGDLAWPTLEKIGEELSIGTRERVRQIIKDNFKSKAHISELPILNSALDYISRIEFAPIPDVRQELLDRGILSPNTRVRGLLNLGEDLSCLDGYQLVDNKLHKLTRDEAEFDERTFIGRKSEIKTLKKDLQKARTLPGQLGLARFSYLEKELGGDRAAQIKRFIQLDEQAEFIRHDDSIWYIFEERDNTLVNWCGKVSTVAPQVNAVVLAEALAGSLKRRAQKYEYPDAEVIEKWIYQSKWFERTGETVSFLGTPQQLTDVETSVVDYLSGHQNVKYTPLKNHLLSLKYSKPNLDKAVTKSPLVYVDRSGKRSSYTYTLISEMPTTRELDHNADDRYERYHNRLKKLASTSGTEASRELFVRTEQSILREWLFEDKSEEKCAICHKNFSVSSLVTAHKKKRSMCAESEKVDPNVVFPLCLFGCDYLFETGKVRIENGLVVTDLDGGGTTEDEVVAASLHGNKVEERWLKGRNYFSQ